MNSLEDDFFHHSINRDKLKILPIQTFRPDCVRKRSNWSNITGPFQFEKPGFSPKATMAAAAERSPKLDHLIRHIQQLDDKDLKETGSLYKHFIFTDLKSSTYGAKMIASGLLASGKTPAFKKGNSGVVVRSAAELDATPFQNFLLLSSVSVYGKPMTVATKKEVLGRFNQRPENIQGKNVRFIILDSGFKEGIDLFDVKYAHIFEPPTNTADKKQIIGRGTRKCGQSGLVFHPTRGWPLQVFIYDIAIPTELQPKLMNAETLFDLYLKSSQIDLRMLEFAKELEDATIVGAVDYELTKQIHQFRPDAVAPIRKKEKMDGGKGQEEVIPFPDKRWNHEKMREFILAYFKTGCEWKNIVMENKCVRRAPEPKKEKMDGGRAVIGGALSCNQQQSRIAPFSPTQEFIHRYFVPENPIKGMLLWQGTGVGKTCTAIATATDTFERQGYTILWVTRTTLKEDIWKNMFDTFICHEGFRERLQKCELDMPADRKDQKALLSKAWNIRPMSYKQFSNLVSMKNDFYHDLVKINGMEDPLRRTLLIIDEAHKLYGGNDLIANEKPDMDALHSALMKSYAISGKDSVRLLLMTATPITVDAMEMIQLVNLCKPIEEQMPEAFYAFADQYLDDNGAFTIPGKKAYLNDIAGYISYLNLEKDAREFSQPVIEKIEVPLFRNEKEAAVFTQPAASVLTAKMAELEHTLTNYTEEIEQLKNQADWISKHYSKQEILGKIKGGTDGDNKMATKHANQALTAIKEKWGMKMKEAVQEKKAAIQGVEAEIKRIKAQLKENKTVLKSYENSVYSALQEKCAEVGRDEKTLENQLLFHPAILKINQDLEVLNAEKDQIVAELAVLEKDYEFKTRFLKTLPEKARQEELENNPEFVHTFDLIQQKRMELKPTVEELEKRRKDLMKEKNRLFQELKEGWLKRARVEFGENVKAAAKAAKANKTRKNAKGATKANKTQKRTLQMVDETIQDDIEGIIRQHGEKAKREVEEKTVGAVANKTRKRKLKISQ